MFLGKRLDLPLFVLILPFLPVFTCVLSFIGHPVLLLPQAEKNRETTINEAIRNVSLDFFMFFLAENEKS